MESYLQKMRLTKDTEDLDPFFQRVYEFYFETSRKMLEYFRKPVQSEILKAITVISPSNYTLHWLKRGKNGSSWLITFTML